MNKRAASPKKLRSKKIWNKQYRYKHLEFPDNRNIGIKEKLIPLGISILVQLGYKCNSKNITFTNNTRKVLYLVLSILSFFVSLLFVNDTDIKGLLGTLFGTTILIVECLLAHEELVNKGNSEIPLSDLLHIRSPIGTRLILYFFIALFGVVAFILSGSQRWLINTTIFVIEGIDLILSALVVLFDAEAVVG